MKSFAVTTDYKEWLESIASHFKASQIKAASKVNQEMLKFYWFLGKEISEKYPGKKRNASFFKVLSNDLSRKIPGVKGFSENNLRYIQHFYELYLPQVVEDKKSVIDNRIFQVPWGHHRFLIDKCKKNQKKALFFIEKIFENGWSRNILLNFLDTDLYERSGKAISNFSKTLPLKESDLTQQMTKDPYNFDFLSLGLTHDEKMLKDSLIQHIEKFLLELGKGFAYVGREYHLDVGGTDQYIDLLFYHFILHRFVVIEIKMGPFQPEHLGQLGAYVSAVNNMLNSKLDNPAVGLLICKEKNSILAKYTLEAMNIPLGVSEYKLMPSVKELQDSLIEKM